MDTDYQDMNYPASVHPEMAYCHSEPFDRLRINSAKNLLQTKEVRDSSLLSLLKMTLES